MKIVTTEHFKNDIKAVYKAEAIGENGEAFSSGYFTFTKSAFGDGWIETLLAGGVGTPVHYRRNGNVREIFNTMHEKGAEMGTAVALLHPFSFAFYRKLGYEKVADHLIVRFPTRMLDFVPRRCDLVPCDEQNCKDIARVYSAFAKGRNLLLYHTEGDYGISKDKNAYICYHNGEPVAYVIYSAKNKFVVNHMAEGCLTVHEMAYTCVQGLKSIFSFLRMFEGEYDEIELANIAMCPEAEMMLRHYTHTSYTVVPDIMARVINTEMMLKANNYPLQEGEFTVKIEDAMKSVKGTFNVSYGNGECSVARVNKTADITLTAGAFARLVYGYDGATAEIAKYMDGVQIDRNCDDFFRAFPKKSCGIFEHF